MDSDVKLAAVLSAGLFVVMVLIWVMASSCEARSYERVTGKRVSTRDAMFLELRVQEPAK